MSDLAQARMEMNTVETDGKMAVQHHKHEVDNKILRWSLMFAWL